MTRNIIFTFIFVLTFALTPFSRATAQDASVGGGAGGGIITADLKNIFLQSKQLAEAYKQYQQLLSIQGQQKLIYETLGLSGEDMEFLTEVGNLINTACNTKIPGFSYWFNFNLPLPPLPRDPCSLALAYLPYDTNYYTDFMNQTTGAATNVLNDPTKLNTELKSYPNSLKIVRDWFYINPNAHEGGIPPELEIEKRQNRQKAAASFQASSPAPQPSAPSQYTYHQPTTGQGPNVPYSPIDLESMLKAQKTYAEDSFNAQKDFTVRKDESSMHIATGLRTGLSALRVMPTPAAIEVVTDEKGNLRIVSDEVKPVTPLLQLASFVENSRPR
jgi:hypothetical protein